MESFERHIEKALNKICIDKCPRVNECPEMYECDKRKLLKKCIIMGIVILEDISSSDADE